MLTGCAVLGDFLSATRTQPLHCNVECQGGVLYKPLSIKRNIHKNRTHLCSLFFLPPLCMP